MRRAGSSRCPQLRYVRQQPPVPFGAVAATDEQLRLASLLRSRASLTLLLQGGKMRRAGSFRRPQLRFVWQQPPVSFGAVASADEQLRLTLLLRSRASLALLVGARCVAPAAPAARSSASCGSSRPCPSGPRPPRTSSFGSLCRFDRALRLLSFYMGARCVAPAASAARSPASRGSSRPCPSGPWPPLMSSFGSLRCFVRGCVGAPKPPSLNPRDQRSIL